DGVGLVAVDRWQRRAEHATEVHLVDVALADVLADAHDAVAVAVGARRARPRVCLGPPPRRGGAREDVPGHSAGREVVALGPPTLTLGEAPRVPTSLEVEDDEPQPLVVEPSTPLLGREVDAVDDPGGARAGERR